jgi:hypothetical protein
MGMFDTLICKYPLPNPKDQELEFQTKSLNCELDTYEIDSDGQLILRGANPEVIEDIDQEIIFYALVKHDDRYSCIQYRACYIDGELQWIRKSKVYRDYREE